MFVAKAVHSSFSGIDFSYATQLFQEAANSLDGMRRLLQQATEYEAPDDCLVSLHAGIACMKAYDQNVSDLARSWGSALRDLLHQHVEEAVAYSRSASQYVESDYGDADFQIPDSRINPSQIRQTARSLDR